MAEGTGACANQEQRAGRSADIERELQAKSQNDADAFVNSAGAFRNRAKRSDDIRLPVGVESRGPHLLPLEPSPKDPSRGSAAKSQKRSSRILT
jgi:hypothetical protein